jgi:glyoxylase-like metal-dependent hydrolase (beta-lactamase superfamily II)
MNQVITTIDLSGVNCYLLKEGGGFILVDTGGSLFFDKTPDNRRNKLVEALDKAGCNASNLKLIILTHGDSDHTANAVFIREKYNAKIAMHKDDLQLVENPTIEKVLGNCKYRSIINKIIFPLIKNKIIKITEKTLGNFERFKPDIYLNDGDSLSNFGFNAGIIHIPGHTAGSIGIVTADGNLISGDILANIKKPEFAPNALDFKLLRDSFNHIKTMNIKTVYPGHGTPFEFSSFNKL